RAGVKDMVRISDARMSGTAYGTIVLHVSPESAVGGSLALVHNGDGIRLSVKKRTIELAVSEEELRKRKAAWKPPVAPPTRGYAKLYMDHVLQAEHGCDFDFLRKARLPSVVVLQLVRTFVVDDQPRRTPAELARRQRGVQADDAPRDFLCVAGLEFLAFVAAQRIRVVELRLGAAGAHHHPGPFPLRRQAGRQAGKNLLHRL